MTGRKRSSVKKEKDIKNTKKNKSTDSLAKKSSLPEEGSSKELNRKRRESSSSIKKNNRETERLPLSMDSIKNRDGDDRVLASDSNPDLHDELNYVKPEEGVVNVEEMKNIEPEEVEISGADFDGKFESSDKGKGKDIEKVEKEESEEEDKSRGLDSNAGFDAKNLDSNNNDDDHTGNTNFGKLILLLTFSTVFVALFLFFLIKNIRRPEKKIFNYSGSSMNSGEKNSKKKVN